MLSGDVLMNASLLLILWVSTEAAYEVIIHVLELFAMYSKVCLRGKRAIFLNFFYVGIPFVFTWFFLFMRDQVAN